MPASKKKTNLAAAKPKPKTKPAPKRKPADAAELQPAALPGAFRLFAATWALLAKNWKLFGGIALVYGALNLLLVQGFGLGSQAAQNQVVFGSAFGNGNKLSTAVSSFLYLFNGDGSNAAAGVYRVIVVLLVSLALIWALREVHAGRNLRVRDSFYKGMYPLVPFSLVLALLILQLAPMAIGVAVYNAVVLTGIAGLGAERLLWIGGCLALGTVSVYFVTTSIFALYIASLPDMPPLRALRSARELIRGRRLLVVRKVLFLPVALLVCMGVIVVPLLSVWPAAAGWVFFFLLIVMLPAVHGYLYNLYRSLL